MIPPASILLIYLLNGAAAFAPISSMSLPRYQIMAETRGNHFFSTTLPLEIVDQDSADPADDPFENYRTTDEQTEIAIKDTKIGSGSAVGDAEGQLLSIKYTAKFLNGNKRQFDVNDDFLCKTGQQSILPGLEEGLRGMNVGGSRLIRIPPTKGYGDKWYKGIVPPNSHLEFDCTLMRVASSPQEEFMMRLEKFGLGRVVGTVLCFSYLAVSPILEKNGIL